MKTHLFLYGVFLLIPFTVFAKSDACLIQSTQDVLDCVLQNHSEVRQSQIVSERDKALEKIARQRPNPEIATEIVARADAGEDLFTSDSSLLQTIETGGKRKARIRQARAYGDLAHISHQETKERTALNTVLALYRLRQIQEELHYVRESFETFDQILGQLKSRPLLSPEQEVSLSLFTLTREDYGLKQKSLWNEQAPLKNFLEAATGQSFSEIEKFLPKSKTSWPEISEISERENSFQNAEVKKAQAELKRAQADLDLAKSQSWPDVKLGPTVETATQAGETITLIGGTLSLPLPLWNQNRGGRAYAALEKNRASLDLELTQKKTASERARLVQRYRLAISGTSEADTTALTSKHHQVDRLFGKGLAPSSLVIETHRQILEFKKSLHEQELTALDALWRIYIIDGKVFEEKI